MNLHEINCRWIDNVAFEARDNRGHSLVMEAHEKYGGQNQGFLPKPLLLASLAGCMGMDIIMILKKMRIELEYFNVRSVGEMNNEEPRYYHKIHLVYEFKGNDLPLEKLQRAIDLSKDDYCNVSALLSKGAEITHEIVIIKD